MEQGWPRETSNGGAKRSWS